LRAHFFRYGKAGSVIARAVDTLSGSEPLHVFIRFEVIEFQLPLCEESAHIVIDNHRIHP
jgi:hypothetical protein